LRHAAANRVTDDLPWHFGCKFNERSSLVRTKAISAAFLLMPAALAWMLRTPQSVTPSQPAPAHRPLRIAAPNDLDAPREPAPDIDRQDSDGTVDLYGNEVSDAVAKYRIDTTGSLYELHSPRTELPRLGSPKT
jgi:hypothetical protein